MFEEWKPVACPCGGTPKVSDVYDGVVEAKVRCPDCGRTVCAYSSDEGRDTEDVVLEAISKWNSEIKEETDSKSLGTTVNQETESAVSRALGYLAILKEVQKKEDKNESDSVQ